MDTAAATRETLFMSKALLRAMSDWIKWPAMSCLEITWLRPSKTDTNEKTRARPTRYMVDASESTRTARIKARKTRKRPTVARIPCNAEKVTPKIAAVRMGPS